MKNSIEQIVKNEDPLPQSIILTHYDSDFMVFLRVDLLNHQTQTVIVRKNTETVCSSEKEMMTLVSTLLYGDTGPYYQTQVKRAVQKWNISDNREIALIINDYMGVVVFRYEEMFIIYYGHGELSTKYEFPFSMRGPVTYAWDGRIFPGGKRFLFLNAHDWKKLVEYVFVDPDSHLNIGGIEVEYLVHTVMKLVPRGDQKRVARQYWDKTKKFANALSQYLTVTEMRDLADAKARGAGTPDADIHYYRDMAAAEFLRRRAARHGGVAG